MKKKNRKIISEDQGGDSSGYSSYGGYDSGLYTGGGWWQQGVGSSSDLYKVFIQPFVNVVRVGLGGAKELVRRSFTLANVVFQAVMTSLIPILGDTYREVFAEEARDIAKIRSEYADVYATSLRILGTDAAAIAFFTAPGAVLTGYFLKNSPKIAKSLLSTVTGGMYSYSSSKTSPKGSGIFDSYVPRGNFLAEDRETDIKSYIRTKQKIDSQLLASPVAGFLKREATKIYKKTLLNAYAEATSVVSAKRIEDIEKVIGGKIPEFEEIRKLPPVEKMKAERDLIYKMKESMKKLYTQPLYDRINQARKSGIPDENPYIMDHLDMIQKIKRL